MIGIEVEKINEPKLKYPCLMKGKISEAIILMHTEKKGTVVNPGGYYRIGEYSDDWEMDQLELFEDKLILYNER